MSPTQNKSSASYILRHWYWAVALFLGCAVWLGLALAMRPGKDLAASPYGVSTSPENRALDFLFQLRDVLHPNLRTRGTDEPITIIEIDERAVKASGVRLASWRRDWYARLIERAHKGGAIVIGLDNLLSEEGGATPESKAYDQELASVIRDAGNVVIANKLPLGGFEAITPLPLFGEEAFGTGFVDVTVDSDGVTRSLFLAERLPTGEEQTSFATNLAEAYANATRNPAEEPQFLARMDAQTMRLGQLILPLRTDGNFQLDFRGRTPAFRRISAADILFPKEATSDDLFRDRIVLIGVNVINEDQFATPFFESFTPLPWLDPKLSTAPVRTPGVELHANAVATMLFGRSPVRPRYGWQVLSLMLPLALVALAVFRLRALWGMLTVLSVAAITLAVSSWAFNSHGMILPLASACVGMIILTPLGLGLRYTRERMLHDEAEANRAQVMDILSRCVSKEVAAELWERRDQIMSGERRVVSIIFTDIRSFTTLSENAPSDQVVIWLNDYFSRMYPIITGHGGHINKFLGDGLMIVFGAPDSRGEAEEARHAVACGLDMLGAVERMNVEWQGTGRPIVKIGVGITTGEATCGVVGAERRLEYTIIGDIVNLSARLEATTKEYGVPLLASEPTALLLDDTYEKRALGEVKVKGKNTSTKIFAVTVKQTAAEVAAPVAVSQ
jgi:adenylate cyclase